MKKQSRSIVVLFTILSVSLLIFSMSGISSGSEGKRIANSIGMSFVLVPAGDFMMGSRESAEAVANNPAYSDKPGKVNWFKDEHPMHRVTLTKQFYLQTTGVTIDQFRVFVSATGYRTDAEKEGWAWAYDYDQAKWVKKNGINWKNPGFPQKGDHPVASISWNDAVAFIKWLNRKEGTDRYRLPTEAEREYACRAGTDTPFYWGSSPDGRYANFGDLSYSKAHPKDKYINKSADDGYAYTSPAGSFRPNSFGLFDMSGNMYDWCSDWYGDYPSGHVTDPEGPSSGKYRVLRGGSWGNIAGSLRSADRRGTPYGRSLLTGFRVARMF